MELTAPESPNPECSDVTHDAPRARSAATTLSTSSTSPRQLGLFADGAGEAEDVSLVRGEASFASPEVQLQRRAELLGAGALVVTVPELPRSLRGRLAEHIDERIERELAARGAPSPYLASWSAMPDDVEARLADQLFRARSVGAQGIAILLGPLGHGREPLTADDSATMRFLLKSTADRPLVVLVDDADRRLRAYEAPVPIARWLKDGVKDVPIVTPSPPPAAPVAEARAATDDVVPDPTASEVSLAGEHAADEIAAEIAAELAVVEAINAMASEPPPAMPATTATARDAAEEILAAAPSVADEDEDEDDDEDEEILGEVVEDEESVACDADEVAPEAELAELPEMTEKAPPVIPAEVPRATAEQRATVGVPVAGPSDAWRAWALALSATRGPLPLPAFEKLFAESYMPLANAIASGLDDPRALRAHDEFGRAFERAYLDGSATFGVTTRRPRMVMDAFDLALKHARAHNARTTQVLLVDSLRFDLGAHARDAVARLAAGRASLANESLVWSAMPTTTVRQLETLARGVDALRAPAQGEPPPESLRGRTAEHARRLRVGSRELFKLDVVPSLLAQMASARSFTSEGDLVTSAFPKVGEAVGEAIVRHIASLAPRTLLYVVGDHGFTVDRRGRLSHGGASPEEVLVPAQAWLIGELH